MRHGLSIYLITCFSIIVCSGLLTTFWLLYPYKTAVVKQPMIVINHVVKAGGEVAYIVDYCKYTDAPASVTRYLDGNISYYLNEMEAHIGQGCGKFQAYLKIPMEVEHGFYHITVKNHYHVNPIRDVTVDFISEPFQVI